MEDISRETKLNHIEEVLKTHPDIPYQRLINELAEDGIKVNTEQIAIVRKKMGIATSENGKPRGGRPKKDKQSEPRENGRPKPNNNLIDIDHFAAALAAAEAIGSWRKLAELAAKVADKLEG